MHSPRLPRLSGPFRRFISPLLKAAILIVSLLHVWELFARAWSRHRENDEGPEGGMAPGRPERPPRHGE